MIIEKTILSSAFDNSDDDPGSYAGVYSKISQGLELPLYEVFCFLFFLNCPIKNKLLG